MREAYLAIVLASSSVRLVPHILVLPLSPDRDLARADPIFMHVSNNRS